MDQKVIDIKSYKPFKKIIKEKLIDDEIMVSEMYSADFTKEFNEKLKEERSKKKNETRKNDR